MPIRVTRRPYTDCPFRWTLSVAGVSGGEGKVSDQQCLDLNGDFDLDFKSCSSQGNLLIWQGGCEAVNQIEGSPCGRGGCVGDELKTTIPWTPPEVTYSGDAEIFWDGDSCRTWWKPTEFSGRLVFNDWLYNRTSLCSWEDYRSGHFETDDPTSVSFPSPETNENGDYRYWWRKNGRWRCDFTLAARLGVGHWLDIHCQIPDLFHPMACYPTGGGYSMYYKDNSQSCDPVVVYTADPSNPNIVVNVFQYSDEVTINFGSQADPVGPDNGDAIRSKWRLSYDIAQSKWTLRSFNRVDYPIYELSDANPCIGDTKTLFRVPPPEEAGDGCNQSPEEVTITRACPPERAARQRKQDKRTGKRFRKCSSCDCQDEPEDTRFTCQDKCESTSDEGCETYSEDQIECKFPKSSDCCDYCDEDKAPCAYEAMFECDIEHEGVSIAAKVVTLRHKCYFEEGAECDWVAVGPSPNPEDGPVGKQPVCASCEDSCLSGCSWSAWSAAECPGGPVRCDSGADKTRCIEFRWEDISAATGFGLSQGGVAAILQYVADIDVDGHSWAFASDDGQWTAVIHHDVSVTESSASLTQLDFCGEGTLSWSSAPSGFPNSQWSTRPSIQNTNEGFSSIAQDGLVWLADEDVPRTTTTLRAYWITCP